MGRLLLLSDASFDIILSKIIINNFVTANVLELRYKSACQSWDLMEDISNNILSIF